MLKKLSSSVVILFALSTGAAHAADQTVKFDTDADKASYGFGLNVGNSLKSQGFPNLNLDALYAGINDAVGGKPERLTKEQIISAFTNIQKTMNDAKAKLAAETLKKGEDFLAKNAKNKGVITTATGLQYQIIKNGTGAKPTAEDVVVTNYRGTLIDGTEFDSSYKRNEPVEFPVNRVIPGWTEALQLMPVGSKWKLFIPAKLAYNDFSPTPAIPPNSTLVFEIELLKVKPKDAKEVGKIDTNTKTAQK